METGLGGRIRPRRGRSLPAAAPALRRRRRPRVALGGGTRVDTPALVWYLNECSEHSFRTCPMAKPGRRSRTGDGDSAKRDRLLDAAFETLRDEGVARASARAIGARG